MVDGVGILIGQRLSVDFNLFFLDFKHDGEGGTAVYFYFTFGKERYISGYRNRLRRYACGSI